MRTAPTSSKNKMILLNAQAHLSDVVPDRPNLDSAAFHFPDREFRERKARDRSGSILFSGRRVHVGGNEGNHGGGTCLWKYLACYRNRHRRDPGHGLSGKPLRPAVQAE